MDYLNCAGEERDLATRRVIQAKVCHSLVKLTLKIDATLPDLGMF